MSVGTALATTNVCLNTATNVFLHYSLIAIFVSAGASGTPSAGSSYTILCLEAVGVPTRFIGLIFAVDWIV